MKEEWAEALKERLAGLGVEADARAPQRLAAYHELLADWNTRLNLTRDADFEDALDRHYMDSLAPLSLGLFPQGASVVDVGTGAGFPGLPLAIARPDLTVVLLDSLQKRLKFLDAVIEALELTNVRTVHARAEDGGRDPALREGVDVAVSRAVAPLPALLELTLPFVRVGGESVCYKGPGAADELDAGARAAHLLGGERPRLIPVAVPCQPEWQHCVVVSHKREKTARQYPRKAGTPSRSPLA